MAEELDLSLINLEGTKKVADPAPKSKSTRPPNRPGAGRPSKASRIKEMEEEVTGFLMMVAMPLMFRDVHEDGSSCAHMIISPDTMELTDNARVLANRFATVGVDNRFISKFFDMGDDVSKWLMLAMAVQPFAQGMLTYHGGSKRKAKLNAVRES